MDGWRCSGDAGDGCLRCRQARVRALGVVGFLSTSGGIDSWRYSFGVGVDGLVLLFGLGVRPSSLDFVPVGGGVFELFSGLFLGLFSNFDCFSIAYFAIRT